MAQRATIVGSGPNGLAAAVALARAGFAVRVVEAASTIGGGVRTAALTLPGFHHDVCSAVHPAALSSPFFRAFGLRDRIDWVRPDASYAQPLDGGRAAIAWRDLDRTAAGLGRDGRAWRAVVEPLGTHLDDLVDFTGNQLLRWPRHPLTVLRFGMRALQVGTPLTGITFRTPEAAALLSGVLAHANTRMPSLGAAASGLFLAAHAHTADGWSFPRGGAQTIADALAADLRAHGGEIETGVRVHDITTLDVGDLAGGDLLLLDTSPRLLLTHPGLPADYARAVRTYRYGAAAAKVDFALDGPVPWEHPDVAASPTVHLGGTAAEVAESENAVAAGRVSSAPYVLAVQPTILDPSRAPAGSHILWAYMHVPAGSRFDPTEAITAQVERFAPGFRRRIRAVHATTAVDQEAYNPSDIGGDILGGAFSVTQAIRRPIVSTTPWRTPLRGIYLASAATPPGPGVTGMPGWLAARQALHDAGSPVELADLFPGR
ncbi:phytoene dehydrogenase-like protein [Microbacterium terrae]|uniref:Pyridine nucleotide-disulfide oxidoreductase domain-containing protein 2 n=1 Tax=Microbacterium terrae TaxID=69369 RepID=A0A0M2HMX9_9MICO|nr:NAD(P)/FAD-dependent oxidoreductase [Microbacterium terrae]KJL45808.1 putative thiazole biosynthetic enzyme [Microbacterium terrae]MBP1076235.1 phytoene dehydrogenase-like protein [Microbacterium terrae]GLJ97058.1 P49 secreted protein [Microbacterium terrae]